MSRKQWPPKPDFGIAVINVIVVKDLAIEEKSIFIGPLARTVQAAEDAFLGCCELYMSNFDEYTADERNALLDTGYAAFGTGNFVTIFWPDTAWIEEIDPRLHKAAEELYAWMNKKRGTALTKKDGTRRPPLSVTGREAALGERLIIALQEGIQYLQELHTKEK